MCSRIAVFQVSNEPPNLVGHPRFDQIHRRGTGLERLPLIRQVQLHVFNEIAEEKSDKHCKGRYVKQAAQGRDGHASPLRTEHLTLQCGGDERHQK